MPRLSRIRFINADRTHLPVRPRIRSRGVPNALQDHPVAFTKDRPAAAELTSQLLGTTRLLNKGNDPGFEFTFNAIQFLDVTLAYLNYAVATDCHVGATPDAYTVHMTTSGEGGVDIGGRRHALTPYIALVVSPGMKYHLELSRDTPQLIMRIERAAIERQLTRLLGKSLDRPVEFEPMGDLTLDAASRWTGALNILFAEVMAPRSLIQQGKGAGALEEFVVSTLLYLQPHNYSRQLIAPQRKSGRVAVRQAIDYIEQHLAEPICLDDLVRHTRMSARTIQTGFREDLNTTPVAFIRDRRLDEVRRVLLAAMPGDGVNVTDAAQRWGFSHLGNFSKLYRQRFGESPSQTLRG